MLKSTVWYKRFENHCNNNKPTILPRLVAVQQKKKMHKNKLSEVNVISTVAPLKPASRIISQNWFRRAILAAEAFFEAILFR